MPKAVVVHQIGGPEAFSYEDIQVGRPGPDEVRMRHHAIGLNFIDTYFRSGLYPWKGDGPIIVGAEASGEVLEVGEKVDGLQPGDRVCYTLPNGAYCEERLVKASQLVKLPDSISHETAASALLKGLTVHYLLHRTFLVKPGHTILFHAAAGGVGTLAGQWASHLGATIIGTVSTEEKAEIAKANGYHHTINYRTEDFVERVKEITNGQGVDVVYDSVGKNTYPQSLHCLKRLGMWVCFGQSSGLIENFDLQHLAQNGSLFATRPTLFNYIATRKELEDSAAALFDVLEKGILKTTIHQRFKLEEAAKVHKLLEGRQTKGATILIP
jgi:NADPH2:quinone reductase